MDNGLEVLPVVNKIDLPNADPAGAIEELEEVVGVPGDFAVAVSAKTGENVGAILEAIVEHLPPPAGDRDAPLSAPYLRRRLRFVPRGDPLFSACSTAPLKRATRSRSVSTGKTFEVDKVGFFEPSLAVVEELGPGEVGWLTASIKNIEDTQIGDTITYAQRPTQHIIPGFKAAQPVVFSGLYPTDSEDYPRLREALEKLSLNDAALYL